MHVTYGRGSLSQLAIDFGIALHSAEIALGKNSTEEKEHRLLIFMFERCRMSSKMKLVITETSKTTSSVRPRLPHNLAK